MKVTTDCKSRSCIYRELLKDDNKNGLFFSIRDMRMKASTKFKKDELVDMLDNLFTDNPFYIIDRLAKNEQDVLSKLIGLRKHPTPILVV